MLQIQGQSILVLGAGVSGVAAAQLAARENARVTLLDTAPEEQLKNVFQELRNSGIECLADFHGTTWERPADLAVISPGIRSESSLGQLAARLSCPVISELAFGAQFCKYPLLAITGSNGKTTTVEMLTMSLNGAGVKAVAGGNIGLPLSRIALEDEPWDYIVAEVSTFQLEHPEGFQPAIAALLNITPDHLDRHGTFEAYRSLKLQLLLQAEENSPVIINSSLLRNRWVAGPLKRRNVITFSAEPDAMATFSCSATALGRNDIQGFSPLLELHQLSFAGKHNYENALCVLAILSQLPIDLQRAIQALSRFSSGHHRIEKVAEVRGVTYVNDSKATNVDSMIKALEFCGVDHAKKIILIAGGMDKGCDLEEAKDCLKMYVKQVFLIGSCRHRLAASWGDVVPVEECENFQNALTSATAIARSGDVVLLSPACASFDMFRSYAQRGQDFVQYVKTLKKELLNEFQ